MTDPKARQHTVVIEVETNLLPLIHAVDMPHGVTKRVEVYGRRSEYAQSLVILMIAIPPTVAANVVSQWIYDKYIKHKPSDYIKINGIEAKIDKGEIQKIIEIIISEQE